DASGQLAGRAGGLHHPRVRGGCAALGRCSGGAAPTLDERFAGLPIGQTLFCAPRRALRPFPRGGALTRSDMQEEQLVGLVRNVHYGAAFVALVVAPLAMI